MTRTKTTLMTLAALAIPLALATNVYADRDRNYGRDHYRPDHHRDIGRPILGLARSLFSGWDRGTVVVGTAPYGHWTTVTRQVLVEAGHWELQSTPAQSELRRDWRGRLVQVCVRPAETVRVWVGDRYQTVAERVWVCD